MSGKRVVEELLEAVPGAVVRVSLMDSAICLSAKGMPASRSIACGGEEIRTIS